MPVLRTPAEETARLLELERDVALVASPGGPPKSLPPPLPLTTDDGVAERTVERCRLRRQLRSSTDRAVPAFRHTLRLEAQASAEGGLVATSLLDAKNTVAAALHEHEQNARMRGVLEADVAAWIQRSTRDAPTDVEGAVTDRVDEEEVQGQLGAAVVELDTSGFVASVRRLQNVESRFSDLTSCARAQAEARRGAPPRTVGCLTEMSFDCSLGSGLAPSDDDDETGSDEEHAVSQPWAIAERRVQRRNALLTKLLRQWEAHQRHFKHRVAELEKENGTLGLRVKELEGLAHLLQSGQGFTTAWRVLEDDEAAEEDLRRAVADAVAQVQSQVPLTTVGATGDRDIEDTKLAVRSLDDDNINAIVAHERDMLRVQVRDAAKECKALRRVCADAEARQAEATQAVNRWQRQAETAEARVDALSAAVASQQVEAAEATAELVRTRRMHDEALVARAQDAAAREELAAQETVALQQQLADTRRELEDEVATGHLQLQVAGQQLERERAEAKLHIAAVQKLADDAAAEAAEHEGALGRVAAGMRGAMDAVAGYVAEAQGVVARHVDPAEIEPLRSGAWDALRGCSIALVRLLTAGFVSLEDTAGARAVLQQATVAEMPRTAARRASLLRAPPVVEAALQQSADLQAALDATESTRAAADDELQAVRAEAAHLRQQHSEAQVALTELRATSLTGPGLGPRRRDSRAPSPSSSTRGSPAPRAVASAPPPRTVVPPTDAVPLPSLEHAPAQHCSGVPLGASAVLEGATGGGAGTTAGDGLSALPTQTPGMPPPRPVAALASIGATSTPAGLPRDSAKAAEPSHVAQPVSRPALSRGELSTRPPQAVASRPVLLASAGRAAQPISTAATLETEGDAARCMPALSSVSCAYRQATALLYAVVGAAAREDTQRPGFPDVAVVQGHLAEAGMHRAAAGKAVRHLWRVHARGLGRPRFPLRSELLRCHAKLASSLEGEVAALRAVWGRLRRRQLPALQKAHAVRDSRPLGLPLRTTIPRSVPPLRKSSLLRRPSSATPAGGAIVPFVTRTAVATQTDPLGTDRPQPHRPLVRPRSTPGSVAVSEPPAEPGPTAHCSLPGSPVAGVSMDPELPGVPEADASLALAADVAAVEAQTDMEPLADYLLHLLREAPPAVPDPRAPQETPVPRSLPQHGPLASVDPRRNVVSWLRGALRRFATAASMRRPRATTPALSRPGSALPVVNYPACLEVGGAEVAGALR